MLESTSTGLLKPGAAHDNAPDKPPHKRLRTIEEAGKLGIPFTTGLLIGIGETPEDRIETLAAIRKLHRRYGHIQEVIVQNFRVKPDIPMRNWAEPSREDMLRTAAVARLMMPDVNLQAPPNLSAPNYEELLDAAVEAAVNLPDAPQDLNGWKWGASTNCDVCNGFSSTPRPIRRDTRSWIVTACSLYRQT